MTTIQLRRGEAALAQAHNSTLAAGEIGVETDTGKFKIGDGATAWNDLAYATDLSRLPTSLLNTASSEKGQIPVADGAGGYAWTAQSTASTGTTSSDSSSTAYLTTDNSGFVGSTLADTAIIQNANTQWYAESGSLIMTSCQVRATATRLMFEVDTPGTGLTAGQNLLGIYSTAGELVMSLGDMTDIYTNTAEYTPVVVSLPSSLTAGSYYVAQVTNYSSSHSLYLTGWYAPMVSEIGTLVSTPPRVCSASSFSYTSLPSSVDWSTDGFNENPWQFVTFFAFLP